MRIETEIVDDDLERVWIDTTPPGYCLHPSGLLVPATMVQPRRHPVGVDLFAGCGGFSLGMEAAGFDVRVAVDHWPVAAFTYVYNLGAHDGRFLFTDPGAEESFRHEVAKISPVDGAEVDMIDLRSEAELADAEDEIEDEQDDPQGRLW